MNKQQYHVGKSQGREFLSVSSFFRLTPPGGNLFPIYADIPQAEWNELSFLGTPQTIVISKGGKVLHNWIGAYQGAVKNAIQKFFGVKLPALQ